MGLGNESKYWISRIKLYGEETWLKYLAKNHQVKVDGWVLKDLFSSSADLPSPVSKTCFSDGLIGCVGGCVSFARFLCLTAATATAITINKTNPPTISITFVGVSYRTTEVVGFLADARLPAFSTSSIA